MEQNAVTRPFALIQLALTALLVNSDVAAAAFSDPTRGLLADACVIEMQRRPSAVGKAAAACDCILQYLSGPNGTLFLGGRRVDLSEGDWLQIAGVLRQGIGRYSSSAALPEHIVRIAEALPTMRLFPEVKACAGL